jgi:multicomponent Na+:H+ antiporter subunit E
MTPTRAIAGRFGLFLAFWLMIAGYHPADLAVGLAAAAWATWTSLRLLPVSGLHVHFLPLASLVVDFLRQSVGAGAQVAWVALHPSMPLRPGFVAYATHLRSAGGRSAFCALSSLLPGTLPTGTDEYGALSIHCLDVDQSVVANLAKEEDLFLQVLRDD